MQDKFKKGYIEEKVFDGEYGTYLQNPFSVQQRSEIIGRRMLLCRKKAGMSQNDVCSVIGLSPQTYSGYENGKHEPTNETLVRLAYLYNVSLDYLMGKFYDDEEKDALQSIDNITDNETFEGLQIQVNEIQAKIDYIIKNNLIIK